VSNSELEERGFGKLYHTYQKADIPRPRYPECLQLLENRGVFLRPSYQMMELELLASKDSVDRFAVTEIEDGAVPYEQ